MWNLPQRSNVQISVNIFFSILILITFLGLAVELAHASFPVHSILINSLLRSICTLYLGNTIVTTPKISWLVSVSPKMHRELTPRHFSLLLIKILPYFASWLTAKRYYKIELYNSSVTGTNVTASVDQEVERDTGAGEQAEYWARCRSCVPSHRLQLHTTHPALEERVRVSLERCRRAIILSFFFL